MDFFNEIVYNETLPKIIFGSVSARNVDKIVWMSTFILYTRKTFAKEQGRTLDLSTTVNCVEVRLSLSSCEERETCGSSAKAKSL